MTVPLKEDKQGTIKTLYAAKPDKTGWVDEIELTTTRQEQLIYFTTIDELKSKGYTCVGVLVEVRDALLHGTGWTTCNLYLPLTIKSEAKVNTVYEVVKDTRVWDQPTVNNFTMQGKAYPYTMSGKYLSGYPTPASYVYADGYEKSVYNNDGVMTGGHRYGYLWGNSLLVVGYKASIKKEILDFNKDGSKKTAYDMDINERIVTFGLTAKATTDIVTSSSSKTNLYITDTLPKDLTYIQGTSYGFGTNER